MDANKILGEYRGWLYKTAGQILSHSSPDLEDLVQEGRIAMWQAIESYDSSKGALPAWLTRKARYRMMAVATGKGLTGQPSRRHGRYKAVEPPTLSLDAERTEDGATLAELVADPSDPIERAEIAYHRAEIAAARRHLTPAQQRYIAARFYAQLSHREMVLAGIFAYDPSALFNSLVNGAKGKLAAELAHLKEVTS